VEKHRYRVPKYDELDCLSKLLPALTRNMRVDYVMQKLLMARKHRRELQSIVCRVGCRRAVAPLRGWSSLLLPSLRSNLPAIVAPRGVSPDKLAIGVDKPSGENVAPIKHSDAHARAVLEFLNDLERTKIVCFARVFSIRLALTNGHMHCTSLSSSYLCFELFRCLSLVPLPRVEVVLVGSLHHC
jgi:hypothetical protein